MINSTDREEWLTNAAQLIIDERIYPEMPAGAQTAPAPFRVSVGFPPRSRANSKVIAVCCASRASADGHNEIFVTPQLSDSLEILAALTHELVHQSDDCQSGHRNHFARVARRIGLEGPLTATIAGDDLTAYLHTIIDLQGPIPHAALNLDKAKPKQSTRMIKMECNETSCGFNFRTSNKQLGKLTSSRPTCPACNQGYMVIV